MNDLNDLYVELTEGPLAVELAPLIAARNDTGIFDVLNRKDISVYGKVPVNDFAMWAAATGLRSSIQDHAEDKLSPLRAIALTILDLLTGNLDRALDFSLAGNIAMLNAWVVAGVLTEVQRDGLLAISTKMVSRADQLGGLSVSKISDSLNTMISI